MNHKEILNKYTHPYGEIFKPKMIEFVREVIKDDHISNVYWTDLFDYGKMEQFLQDNNINTSEDELKFLDDNKYKYDGYIKSCQDLDGKNYKELPNFIAERLEFMATYSHIMLILRLHCIHELCEEFDIVLNGRELIDMYIIYTIAKWNDELYRELHGDEYYEIIKDNIYYNRIKDNLYKIGLEYEIITDENS
jgi:hypothetical protein